MPAFTLQAARCPSVLLAVAPCVCRCPLAAVVRKQSLHHRSSSRSAHHVPPTTTSVVFLLVWFSNLQSFVCLGISAHKQRFDFKYCFVLRGLVPEEIDRDYSRLPVARRLFRPWAVRAVVYGVFVPAVGATISGHVGV